MLSLINMKANRDSPEHKGEYGGDFVGDGHLDIHPVFHVCELNPPFVLQTFQGRRVSGSGVGGRGSGLGVCDLGLSRCGRDSEDGFCREHEMCNWALRL